MTTGDDAAQPDAASPNVPCRYARHPETPDASSRPRPVLPAPRSSQAAASTPQSGASLKPSAILASSRSPSPKLHRPIRSAPRWDRQTLTVKASDVRKKLVQYYESLPSQPILQIELAEARTHHSSTGRQLKYHLFFSPLDWAGISLRVRCADQPQPPRIECEATRFCTVDGATHRGTRAATRRTSTQVRLPALQQSQRGCR